MNSLFLVTSGIYSSYGKNSIEERINQTKETIQSIRKYIPKSSIVLLDCGEKSIDKNLFDCKIIDYTTHLETHYYLNKYLQSNKDIRPEIIIKSMLEIMMIEDYLKTSVIDMYTRIFKLSGRYRLNSKFNYNKHLKAKNKVVVLPPCKSQHFYNFDISISIFYYLTRCWSFDSSIRMNILETYGKMKKDIIKLSQTKKQGDVEHLFYKHLNKKLVEHIDVMGIEGYWSPLEKFIKE